MSLIYPLAAGILITIQSIFNSRISEKIGLWETVTYVHILGLALSLVVLNLYGKGSLLKCIEVNKIYLVSGFLGVIIVYAVIKGVLTLGATFSIGVLLIAQLAASMIIDSWGLFGVEKIAVNIYKVSGLFLMILGIVIFKVK